MGVEQKNWRNPPLRTKFDPGRGRALPEVCLVTNSRLKDQRWNAQRPVLHGEDTRAGFATGADLADAEA